MNEAQALDAVIKLRDALLLPCPWCGPVERERPILECEKKKGFGQVYYFTVQCCNCGACPDYMCETPEQAISLWNTRAIPGEYESNWTVFERCKDLMREFLDKIDASHV